MPTQHTALAKFLATKIVARDAAPYTLASGAVSDFYIDGKLATLHAEGMRLIAEAVHDELRTLSEPVEAVGGLEMGATPIVSAVVATSGHEMHGLLVRKGQKGHGLGKRIEGPVAEGMRVAVVDDVVTRGSSIVQAIEALQAAGCVVVMAIAMVDRGEGGRATVEAAGVPYHVLCTLADIGVV